VAEPAAEAAEPAPEVAEVAPEVAEPAAVVPEVAPEAAEPAPQPAAPPAPAEPRSPGAAAASGQPQGARPPGAGQATGQAGPAATKPGRPSSAVQPAEPSWATVLATTVRLWIRRRLASPRWRLVFVLVLVAVVFAAVAVPLILSRGNSGQQAASRSGSQAGTHTGGVLGAAVARRQAAQWIAQQVNGDADVACDPAMCGALEAAGVSAGRLIVLRPGQADPLGSDIVVATAAVRSQFGSRLTSVYAPVSIAGFGTGAARIEIRVEAPDGAAAYLAALAADVAARRAAGARILHNTAVELSPGARSLLAAGQVDSRLIAMLVTLSHSYSVDVISFGGSPASGVSEGVPVRFAEITGVAAGGHPFASISTLRAFLNAQLAPYRPSGVTTMRVASRTVLRIEYPAPSPLGLLGSHGLK
jgi:hypothetical protein